MWKNREHVELVWKRKVKPCSASGSENTHGDSKNNGYNTAKRCRCESCGMVKACVVGVV